MEELNAGTLEYRTPEMDGAEKDGKRRKE